MKKITLSVKNFMREAFYIRRDKETKEIHLACGYGVLLIWLGLILCTVIDDEMIFEWVVTLKDRLSGGA